MMEKFMLLDKTSYKVLKKLYKKNALTYSAIDEFTKTEKGEKQQQSRYISRLRSFKLVEGWTGDKTINDLNDKEQLGYQITLEGRAFIEQRRRELWLFWFPYSITTLIAASSLLSNIIERWSAITSFFCNLGN